MKAYQVLATTKQGEKIGAILLPYGDAILVQNGKYLSAKDFNEQYNIYYVVYYWCNVRPYNPTTTSNIICIDDIYYISINNMLVNLSNGRISYEDITNNNEYYEWFDFTEDLLFQKKLLEKE